MDNQYSNTPKPNKRYRSLDGFTVPTSRPLQPRNTASAMTPRPNTFRRREQVSRNRSNASAGNRPLNSSGANAGLPNTLPRIKLDPVSGKQRKYQRSRHMKSRRFVAGILSLVLATLILGGGFIGYRFLGTLDKVFHGNIFSDVTAAFSTTPLKGESTGRVNILLAGDSSDQPGHGGADLTDSILLFSIDTQNHTAFLLSIPRDLWVDIPGWGYQKINAANDNEGTNFPGYPQNGMGQLEHILTTDMGVPIDYYALSDYGAFQDAVNAVGGVTITINSPDPRGLYDPNVQLKLPNGPVTLNGQQALNLARARGDGYGSYGFPDSDFDRTEHQRQLFTAVAQKAKTLGVLADPVKISDLFNSVGNNVETDLSLQNVLRLVQITKGINLSSLQSYAYCSTLTIGQNGCTNPVLTTYNADGEDSLIPTAGIGDYTQMELYYQQLTSSNPVIKEAASVVVLNGTSTNGLAAKEKTNLVGRGVDVVGVGDASALYPTTTIIDNSGGKDPATLNLLKSIYGNTVTTKQVETSSLNPTFIVILGNSSTSTTGSQ